MEMSPSVWRDHYLKAKSVTGVPQVMAAHKYHWERPQDFILSKLGFGLYAISFSKMLRRFWNKKFASRLIEKIAERSAKSSINDSRDYRLFPLQVTNDTQLLLNSDMNNLDSIRVAVDECASAKTPLVIKIHPAETDVDALRVIDKLLWEARGKCEIYVSHEPTEALIRGASLVYTINSSVGLEALILGKPIRVFGRALYTSFVGNPCRMYAYLQSYLIPIDYFDSHSEVPQSSIRMALDRFSAS
jgi:capsular polysaccharide export protein